MHKCRYLLIVLIMGCTDLLQAQAPTTYVQQLEQWKAKRVAALKSEQGWLNLAGLLWVEEGEQYLGTDSSCSLLFPSGIVPAKAAKVRRDGNTVTLQALQPNLFSVQGKALSSITLYHPDSTNQPYVAVGNLRFQAIRRSDRIGLRLRQLDHPAVASFKGVPCFAPDTAYRVKATFVPAPPQFTVAITNVLGQTTPMASPGTVRFTLQGQTHALPCLEENGRLFIIFGDKTNGSTSYGAGRFLYADMPGPDGMVWLDFNMAENPPCAFTPFATCPLPPASNRLRIAITAGEQFAGHDD